MGRTVQIFVAGVITIGVITSLTMNGRTTVSLTKTGGQAAQGLLGTAITGKA